jgi:import receptor subunit TOM70
MTAGNADAAAGWDAYQRGDLETAQTRLAAAAEQPGVHAWVRYALGQADYALGHFPDAATAWDRVRGDVPEFQPVYFDLVDAYLQQSKYPDAARVLLDAVKRWPKDADVYNALGVVDINGGALNDAVNAFDAATRVAPKEGIGYFNLGRALEARYMRARSRVVGSKLLRGAIIANGHDRDEAIENYRHAIELGGPFVDAAQAALKRLGAKP